MRKQGQQGEGCGVGTGLADDGGRGCFSGMFFCVGYTVLVCICTNGVRLLGGMKDVCSVRCRRFGRECR